MAKKRARSGRGNNAGVSFPPSPPTPIGGVGGGPETTGRFIIILKEQAVGQTASVKSMLHKTAGIKSADVATSSDFAENAVPTGAAAPENAVHFEKLGIVVVSGPDAVQAMAASVASADSQILAIEPEYYAVPLGTPTAPSLPAGSPFPLEYLAGYRDAVNELYEQLSRRASVQSGDLIAAGATAAGFQDNDQYTWGLQATGVDASSWTGQGARVAVLDTGIDLQHPDFRLRPIVTQSFITGVSVQDVFGHGTHCCGTACGPLGPAAGGPRYGVAYNAQLFVGKVFDNAPRPQAPTSAVIAGIEWAIAQRCHVVSLSLGVENLNQQIEQYSLPTQRALNAGTLVVAAAGNNAKRSRGYAGFVTPPANADAVLAVGALDNQLQVAEFSSRSSNTAGGLVNISAPGVAVYSSWPGGGHRLDSGTSMACPHVAGIAALWAEATNESGAGLWNRLVQTVQPLSLSGYDVGAGFVQAPE